MNHKKSESSQDSFITNNGIQIRIYKKKVKNINLRINRLGEVVVSAPTRCSSDVIYRFLLQKESWIKEKVDALKKRQRPTSQGIHHCWYLGKCYPVKIHEHDQPPQIRLEENQILCFVKPKTAEETAQRLLTNWHKAQMRALLPDLIKKWEVIIGVTVNQWGIKAMVSRWGSCHTSEKRIWLNLYLIQKPLLCLEYVLVHEMVHLLEPSHNQRFYTLMSRFMPEWIQYKKMLNEN